MDAPLSLEKAASCGFASIAGTLQASAGSVLPGFARQVLLRTLMRCREWIQSLCASARYGLVLLGNSGCHGMAPQLPSNGLEVVLSCKR